MKFLFFSSAFFIPEFSKKFWQKYFAKVRYDLPMCRTLATSTKPLFHQNKNIICVHMYIYVHMYICTYVHVLYVHMYMSYTRNLYKTVIPSKQKQHMYSHPHTTIRTGCPRFPDNNRTSRNLWDKPLGQASRSRFSQTGVTWPFFTKWIGYYKRSKTDAEQQLSFSRL
jgi:hypothetical protein